jgi:quercetin dioxygenase-like cupin family protein
MKYRYLPLVAAIAMFSFAGVQSTAAQDSDAVITGLMNMPLSDIAGKDSNVVLFEVGPGWSIANHFHPGHIFIYMIEGSIKVEVDGKEAEIIKPGEVVYEVPNLNMVASNLSATDGAKFVVFTVGDIGEPVTVFAE